MAAFSSSIPALFHSGPLSEGEIVSVDQDERRHIRALRLKIGDRVQLLDGCGKRSNGEIASLEKRDVTIRIHGTVLEEPEAGVYIGLAIGILSDKSRMEWLIEKGVELGAGAFFLLRSERSEGFFNTDRAHRVAVAALKQSQRPWLPEITGAVEWKGIEEVAETYDLILLCHEQGPGRERFDDVVRNMSSPCRVLVLVGPEGGFSEAEIARAVERLGARVVSLGEHRLRSETAAIGALATLKIMEA